MGVKHGFVRMFGLARKVVILDEVHAYDVYMGTILEHLLQWLGALGAKVILLSATLPSGLRARLLSAFGATTMDIPDAYPVLIHGEGGSPATVVTDPSPETTKRTTLTVEVVEATGDDEALTAAGTAWVVERVRQGGCAAWIRNTVRDAQSAYEALRKLGVEADLLHARFTRHDRGNKEEELLRRYGPPHPVNPARPVARVVIATQVIEQSVDVDFDVMLSDLAPMDLLLQRAGRMHRHERGGLRHGHEQPVLGVLLPDRDARHKLEFGRSAYVYDAETLARSAHLVLSNPTMTLPAACRTLVALLYDCDHSFWNADRLEADKGALDAARERLERHRTMMESTARRTLLTAPDQVPVMRDPFNDRSDAGEHVALATRYGAHTAAAVLFHDSPDGPVPLGIRTPIAVPGEDDWRARLDAEEAIALASVSFPWYGQRPDETPPPALLAPIHAWWRETHPFDDRLFVLLDGEGTFSHHSVEGRYDSVSGLTVVRTRTTHAAAEPAPLEDL
jgi:CRISPR-associated endonuclease/helicase Cas3